MNRYQDEDWQQEEQRKREAYYRMNSQNSNTPDALEQIFRGPLNWMNLLMIGINVVIFIVMEFWEYRGYRVYVAVGCRLQTVHSEWRVVSAVYFYVSAFWNLSSCK